MKAVSFKATNELVRKLELYAMNHRLSKSDVIREALENFLKINECEARAVSVPREVGIK